MKGLSAQASVAIARHYNSREEMIELTGVDPDSIDDDDESTWPPHKVDRTITIDFLAGGAFNVRDGDRYSEGLGFDEMLGTLASLAMPEHRPCLQWLQTKEQHDARSRHFKELREKRQQQTTPTT